MKEVRTNVRLTESEIRNIVANAAASGIELSQPDFRVDQDGTRVTVEHLPAIRFLRNIFN